MRLPPPKVLIVMLQLRSEIFRPKDGVKICCFYSGTHNYRYNNFKKSEKIYVLWSGDQYNKIAYKNDQLI